VLRKERTQNAAAGFAVDELASDWEIEPGIGMHASHSSSVLLHVYGDESLIT